MLDGIVKTPDKHISNFLLLVTLSVYTLCAGTMGMAGSGSPEKPRQLREPQSNSERSIGGAQDQSSLNYEEYRSRIEPVFLKKRQGDVRCYDCHSTLATRFRLQPFLPGDSSWTEEQSRQNFEVVSQLVTPQDPLKSPLLLHPLAQAAGGDPMHAGGKFWESQNDPELQMIADWVRHAS